MSKNGQPVMPVEIHLNSCAIDVFDVEQGGEKMKQIRINHTSGLLPATLVLLLTEEGAKAVATQLRGSGVLLASEIPTISDGR